MRFDELDLPMQVLAGVAHAGFHECTPIQEQSLPLGLSGQDVLGQAQTGTGKTAAFLISTFTRLLNNPPIYSGPEAAPRALVIAPTRELVVQIEKDAQLLGSETGLTTLAVYGGVGYEQQRQDLGRGPDLLVGTPGRLIDYFKQGVYTLMGLETLIIDEADRMFDMGFIDDIRYMMWRMPKPGERQTLLFSATFPQRVKELAYSHMHEPQQVSVSPENITADRVREIMYFVGNHEKFSLLAGLIREIVGSKTMIFVNTKRVGEDLEYWFAANDMEAEFISGDVPQNKRLRLIERFKSGQLSVLIATDVASRGLHIDDVSHVINYDVPQDAEDYVHRIGRTARAGADGDAITLGCETYSEYIIAVEAFIGRKIPVDAADDGLFMPVKQPHRRRERKGGPPDRSRSSSRDQGRGRSGGRSTSGGGGRSGGSGGHERRPGGEARTRDADTPRDVPRNNAATQASGSNPDGNTISAAPGATDAPRKRRRRRRRKPSSGEAVGSSGGGGTEGGATSPNPPSP